MSRLALRPALRMAARGGARRDGFSPSDIPNLVFHVDAGEDVYKDAGSTLCADGEQAQQWNDQSGEDNHASQATANNRPFYRATGFSGQPSVDNEQPSFYQLWMTTPDFLGAGYNTAATMFWLGATTLTTAAPAMSANDTRFASGTMSEWCSFHVSNLGFPIVHYHGVQTLTGNLRCVGVSYDGATLRTIVNGHLVKIARTGNLGLSGALSVGRYSTAGNWFQGDIAEALVWNSAANDTQMRSMCNWLLTKRGLALPTPRKSIVYSGDSLTAFSGTLDRWPNVIAASMGTTAQSHTIVAQNGVNLVYINANAAGWIDPMLDPDSQDLQVSVIWAGTNDAAQGVAGATVYDRLVTYCAARYAAGWDKVVVMTMLPRSGATDHADTETIRQAYNTLIRANWASIADGLIDVAADNRIGDAGDEEDLTYYASDRVHLNAAGHAVVAALAEPVIASLL